MASKLRLVSTAYGPPWGGIQGTGVTSSGIDLRAHPHQYVVAVDPRLIPIGSKLKIAHNPFGDPNIVFTAADTGGAIKGNRLDFFDWRGRKTQMAWGTRPIEAELVGHGNPAHTQRAGAQAPASGSRGGSAIAGDPSAMDSSGAPDLAALIQSLQPVRQQPLSTPPPSPSFAAHAPLPAGYQPILSGPPAPKVPSSTDTLLQLLPALADAGLPASRGGGSRGGGSAVPTGGSAVQTVMPSGRRGKVIVSAGANRAGVPIAPIVTNFVGRLAGLVGRPLTIGTGSAHSRLTVNGNVSDHWDGHASDIPASGATLTKLGRAALILAGMPAHQANRVQGGLFNVNVGGHRAQIIFNTNEGGNHFNHLHVGIR